jgi:hypothetical protein
MTERCQDFCGNILGAAEAYGEDLPSTYVTAVRPEIVLYDQIRFLNIAAQE